MNRYRLAPIAPGQMQADLRISIEVDAESMIDAMEHLLHVMPEFNRWAYIGRTVNIDKPGRSFSDEEAQ